MKQKRRKEIGREIGDRAENDCQTSRRYSNGFLDRGTIRGHLYPSVCSREKKMLTSRNTGSIAIKTFRGIICNHNIAVAKNINVTVK